MVFQLIKSIAMKNLLIVFAGLFLSLSTHAQVHFGIKSGLDIASIDYSGNTATIQDLSTATVNPVIGIYSEYFIAPNWSIKSGIDYSKQSAKLGKTFDVKLFNVQVPIELSTRLTSKNIYIPITAQYYQGIGKAQIFASVGAGMSKAISAQIEPRVKAILEFNLPQLEINTSQFNSNQWYGTAGIGLAYPVANGQIQGSLSYRHSFETLKPEFVVDLDMKQRAIQIGVGYSYSF